MIGLLLACAPGPDDPAPVATVDTSDSGSDDSARPDSADSADDPTGGPCAAYAEPVAMGTVQDPALNELSGLAVSRLNPGVLWTHEDSGGAPALYALDATGATLATLTVEGAENVDWEDLAVGPCDAGWCLYVGDIGDLGAGLAAFTVYVVEEPLLDGTAALSAPAEARPFTYPDAPEDAEGLALLPDGTPLVVTKRADATAGLYRLPMGADVLEPLATVPTGVDGEDLTARATAADLWPDTATLLLRTYLHLYTFDLTDPTAPVGPTNVPFALELQGEAVAWDPVQGGFWQVAEAESPTLWWTGCVE